MIDKCNHYIKIGNKILFQCTQCQKCCSNLSIIDMLIISFELKTIMFNKKCKYVKNNECAVYSKRPNLCKKWECGVLYECK